MIFNNSIITFCSVNILEILTNTHIVNSDVLIAIITVVSNIILFALAEYFKQKRPPTKPP